MDTNAVTKNVYGKIWCDEGVIFERKFSTEAEAKAFVLGFDKAKEELKATDCDFLDDTHAGTHDVPAKDE